MANIKFSQIDNGGAFVRSTDQVMVVRSGTDDKLVTMPVNITAQGTAPTIAANAGAGTAPTIAISGKDNAGTITLTTGTLPSAAADICTTTFNVAFGSGSIVQLTAGNANAAAVAATIYGVGAAANFKIKAVAALTAATQYIWNYQIIGLP